MFHDLHHRADLSEENVLKDDEILVVLDHLHDFECISTIGLFELVAGDERDRFLEREFDIEFARHGENGFAVFLKVIRLGRPACVHRTENYGGGEGYQQLLHLQ